MKMDNIMRENGKKENLMDMELINGLMVQFMKVNS
jgi:hypothetical protein